MDADAYPTISVYSVHRTPQHADFIHKCANGNMEIRTCNVAPVVGWVMGRLLHTRYSCSRYVGVGDCLGLARSVFRIIRTSVSYHTDVRSFEPHVLVDPYLTATPSPCNPLAVRKTSFPVPDSTDLRHQQVVGKLVMQGIV